MVPPRKQGGQNRSKNEPPEPCTTITKAPADPTCGSIAINMLATWLYRLADQRANPLLPSSFPHPPRRVESLRALVLLALRAKTDLGSGPEPIQNHDLSRKMTARTLSREPAGDREAQEQNLKIVLSTSTSVSNQLGTPSMGKALELPLKQTRFGGKWNWVRCNVVSQVGSETSWQN